MRTPAGRVNGCRHARGVSTRGEAAVCIALLVALPGIPGAAPAADSTLEPIIVTAPAERTGDVLIDDHTGAHSRIDGDKLERRDISLDDVLAREAGIQRRRSGGHGSFASITVRASSPAQTSVLLDGVRLDSAGKPVIDLSMLDALSLDTIDIYRSVSPLQFGSSNIGGAINLVTPRAVAGSPFTRVGAGLGSFGLLRAEAAHIARHGRWETVAALGASDSENDFSFVNDNGTPLNNDDDRRERRHNAAAQRVALLFKVGTEHPDSARTDVLLQLAERQLGVPEFRNSADNDARFDTLSVQGQLSHARTLRGRWKTKNTLFLHADDDHFVDRESQVGLGAQDTKTRTRSVGVDTFGTREFDDGSLALKAGLRHDSLSSRDRVRGTRGADAERLQSTLDAQWTRYLFDGRVVLAPALRLQNIDDDLIVPTGGRRSSRANRAVTSWLPSIGVRFDASDRWTWRASLEQARREPSFGELYVDRGLVLGNPDLVAERGVSADAGLHWRRDDMLELSVSVFASERDELIVRTFDAQGIGRAINTGEARVRGLEFAGAWSPHRRWRLSGNATFQDAANVSEDAVLDDRQLPGEAQWQWHASARYRPRDNWQLRVESTTTRGRFYDQANKRPARDSTALNIGIDYTHDRLKAAFAVDNIGDHNVEDFNGFPRPGRALSLYLSYTL